MLFICIVAALILYTYLDYVIIAKILGGKLLRMNPDMLDKLSSAATWAGPMPVSSAATLSVMAGTFSVDGKRGTWIADDSWMGEDIYPDEEQKADELWGKESRKRESKPKKAKTKKAKDLPNPKNLKREIIF